jgi:hypothetical protein
MDLTATPKRMAHRYVPFALVGNVGEDDLDALIPTGEINRKARLGPERSPEPPSRSETSRSRLANRARFVLLGAMATCCPTA